MLAIFEVKSNNYVLTYLSIRYYFLSVYYLNYNEVDLLDSWELYQNFSLTTENYYGSFKFHSIQLIEASSIKKH